MNPADYNCGNHEVIRVSSYWMLVAKEYSVNWVVTLGDSWVATPRPWTVAGLNAIQEAVWSMCRQSTCGGEWPVTAEDARL